MAAATITIPMPSCAAATASCRSTFTFRAARLRPRRCFTAFFSCRRRSAAPARSSGRRHLMSEALAALSSHVAGRFGDRVIDAVIAYGELTVTVARDDIVEVL